MSILKIPSDPENSSAFIQRLADLIRGQGTHVYIDTSFLMWMTKIGSDSRRELIDWLQKNCAGRVHVPIWAAHEYLKHHVARTLTTDLKKEANKVSSLVRRAYAYFRPFIDEPLGRGKEDPFTIRANARGTLEALDRLTSTIKQWDRLYKEHASEVISFINEVTPEKTSVYDHLESITETGNGRFIASIPPGYRDRWKKGRGRQSEGLEDEAPAGSNQYGDLIFWKEVLVHAQNVQAKALVVVTNDRKNDWHLGGSDVIDIDSELLSLKQDWKPVPRPHPMLVTEAKVVAEVDQVELLDSVYLAVILQAMDEDEVRAFFNVAIMPDIEPENESDRRARLLEERIATDTAEASAAADEQRYLLPDSPLVKNSRNGFLRALLASKEVIDKKGDTLLGRWHANVGTKHPFSETVTQEGLDEFDHKGLAHLARELHDRVLQGIRGYEEVLLDLASLLDRLPTNTAAALYLGLLASMYLVRGSNASRLPPSSLVAQRLFEQQSAAYALNGVYAVAKRLSDNEEGPLYRPDSACPEIVITLDTEPNTPMPNQLRSLTVRSPTAGEVELLTPAQKDELLKLSALFDSTRPTDGGAIIRKACDIFFIPTAQVKCESLFKQGYTLTKEIGFKRPEDVKIRKERSDDE